MVRIVIETDGDADKAVTVASDPAGAGAVADGGAGPSGGDEAQATPGALAASDAGPPPAWLTAAIAAAEQGGTGGAGGAEPEPGDATDILAGGPGPQGESEEM
jgi:hypothetical protein